MPSNNDAMALPVVVLSVAAVGPEVMPRVKLKVAEFTSVEFTSWTSEIKPNLRP